MIANLLKNFREDRRGATAMVIALMIVPLVIAAGAAVDFSRVSSARAQLQSAVDAAALAGVGAYQNNQDGTIAYNVASTAFSSSTQTLTNYLTFTAPTGVGTACKASSGCGTTSASNGLTSQCPSTYSYCVQVTAQGSLPNSLLAFWIPSNVLRATAIATTKGTISPSSTNHVDGAGDWNAAYAYAVPLDGPNNSPSYGELPTLSAGCTGPMSKIPGLTKVTCNYQEVDDSTLAAGTQIAGQPSLTLNPPSDPVGFLFVNFTGATSSYPFIKQSDGGYCPGWNLYGAVSQSGVVNPVTGQDYTPAIDSFNLYSSAYELLGDPPSYSSSLADETTPPPGYTVNTPYGTNHQIVGFTIPKGTKVGTSWGGSNAVAEPQAENCPNSPYLTQPAKTSATITDLTAADWNATYYPSNSFVNATMSSENGPPVVGGCTPNNSSITNPDWALNPFNFSPTNIDSAGCPTAQPASYSNCGVIIQDLGATNYGLPDFYAYDPANVIKGLIPIWDGIGNSFTAGQTPTPTPPAISTFTQVVNNVPMTLAAERPSYDGNLNTYDKNLPASTSGKCYDPQNNGQAAYTGSPYIPGDHNNGGPIDLIARPDLGAIECDVSPPHSYALYWNDMGNNENDDLGYWNGVTLFTCPSNPGGAATLSG